MRDMLLPCDIALGTMLSMPPARSPETLTSLRIRNVLHTDLPQMFQYQLDEDANRMAAVHPRNTATFDALWAKILQDPTIVAKAILMDDQLVGSISCFKMEGLDSVGYWISKEYWGKGIASRALSLLLQEVTVRPLHARAARHNIASIRVLQRCGFELVRYQHSPGTERFIECEEAVLILK